MLKDSKKVINDGNHALSEQTQNIVHSLNSSRVHTNTEDRTGHNMLAKLTERPSRESLIDLRRHQRQNRQNILFGSASIKQAANKGIDEGLMLGARPSLPALKEAAESFYQ